MSNKKLYFVLLTLLVLLGLGILGGAYGVDTLLQASSKTLLERKTQSAALDAQQKQLIRDKKDIKAYGDLNKIAKSIVPQDKDQALAVREIVNIAAESKVLRLNSVTFPASTLGGLGAGAKTNLTQLTAVNGIEGVYKLQITVQVNDTSAVPYPTFINFLEHLEQNRRTAQVSNITVTPNAKNSNLVAFTLVIDEYIKP
jgi:hypothetical protein